jgi:hypothetical protein
MPFLRGAADAICHYYEVADAICHLWTATVAIERGQLYG